MWAAYHLPLTLTARLPPQAADLRLATQFSQRERCMEEEYAAI